MANHACVAGVNLGGWLSQYRAASREHFGTFITERDIEQIAGWVIYHVRLPVDAPTPTLAAPEQALGEDLYQHLPDGADGRRWRVLLNEVQVLLHQHPRNAERRTRGLPPVNSLWLWGGGTLPSLVRTPLRGVISDDVLLGALATRAGIATLKVKRVRASETDFGQRPKRDRA